MFTAFLTEGQTAVGEVLSYRVRSTKGGPLAMATIRYTPGETETRTDFSSARKGTGSLLEYCHRTRTPLLVVYLPDSPETVLPLAAVAGPPPETE